MKTHPPVTLIACLWALASTSFGANSAPDAPPMFAAASGANPNPPIRTSAPIQNSRDQHEVSITDLNTQLAGTSWKIDPDSGVRPGLYPTLDFKKYNVEPAGYRYQIDAHDFTVRVYFNHGDTQLMMLTDNGKRLGFTFHGKDYCYVLASRGENEYPDPIEGSHFDLRKSKLDQPESERLTPATGTLPASRENPFRNTLGMRFVPVPGTHALFSVWDTRVQDYAAYAREENVNDLWTKEQRDGAPVSRNPVDPVVGVNWNDAQAFCQWLTRKEIAEGKIPKNAKYRLPTDDEWSRAVGLPPEPGATPAEKSGKNQVDFPWGAGFPPARANVGNYADSAWHEKFPWLGWMEGYKDGYAITSPVGTFPPNAYGLYDMGGNVWNWCEEWLDSDQKVRVQRGGSWVNYQRGYLLSSFRGSSDPGNRFPSFGFRCVLDVSAR